MGDTSVLKRDIGQTSGLWTKQQNVARLKSEVRVPGGALSSESENPGSGRIGEQSVKRRVHGHEREIVVVQAGALEAGFVEFKTQGLDETERRTGDRRKPDSSSGVLRDARLVESDRWQSRLGCVRHDADEAADMFPATIAATSVVVSRRGPGAAV